MELDLSKYETQKKTRNYITTPEIEIRDKYSDLLQWEFPKVCGWTKGMDAGQMWDLYNRAIKWQKNPPALLYMLLKERKTKLKNGIQKTRETNS